MPPAQAASSCGGARAMRVRNGSGTRSTIGAQMNLNEYARPDPREHADGRTLDAVLTQPGRQRLKHQIERQPAEKPRSSIDSIARLPVDEQRGTQPRAPCAGSRRIAGRCSNVVVHHQRGVIRKPFVAVDCRGTAPCRRAICSQPGSRCASRRSWRKPGRGCDHQVYCSAFALTSRNAST